MVLPQMLKGFGGQFYFSISPFPHDCITCCLVEGRGRYLNDLGCSKAVPRDCSNRLTQEPSVFSLQPTCPSLGCA